MNDRFFIEYTELLYNRINTMSWKEIWKLDDEVEHMRIIILRKLRLKRKLRDEYTETHNGKILDSDNDLYKIQFEQRLFHDITKILPIVKKHISMF